MKTMTIEKKLLFDEPITAVKEVSGKQQLSYEKEKDGSIRAQGPLYLEGVMVNAFGRDEKFKEVLEMDILAPYQKLSNQPFSIEVKDIAHQVEEDGILLVIRLDIAGLQNEERSSEVKQQEIVQTSEEKNVVEVVDHIEKEQSENFEDLFEDGGTTYTLYRMIVAQEGDSYEKIAKRYTVEEDKLRLVNHNKDISFKTLVVLPF